MSATSPSAPVAARRGGPRGPRRRLAVVGLVLASVAGFLVYKALTSAVVYFKTAEQAVAQRQVLGDSTFDIEGVVVCGSVHAAGSTVDRFVIASGRTRVEVHNTGLQPELFEAGVPVVLVGHFEGGGDVFASDSILVKHSNSYVAAHPGRVRTPSALSCFSGPT